MDSVTAWFDASLYTHLNWAWDEDGANRLYHKHFFGRKAVPVISKQMAERLNPINDRAYSAEIMHTNLKESFGNRES